MNKEKNVRYFKKMFEWVLLPQDKFDFLMDHWDKVNIGICPKCGKDALEWGII